MEVMLKVIRLVVLMDQKMHLKQLAQLQESQVAHQVQSFSSNLKKLKQLKLVQNQIFQADHLEQVLLISQLIIRIFKHLHLMVQVSQLLMQHLLKLTEQNLISHGLLPIILLLVDQSLHWILHIWNLPMLDVLHLKMWHIEWQQV